MCPLSVSCHHIHNRTKLSANLVHNKIMLDAYMHVYVYAVVYVPILFSLTSIEHSLEHKSSCPPVCQSVAFVVEVVVTQIFSLKSSVKLISVVFVYMPASLVFLEQNKINRAREVMSIEREQNCICVSTSNSFKKQRCHLQRLVF